jgi:glutamyl-tRNA synthetase
MKLLWPAGTNTDNAAFTQKIIADLQPRVKTLVELATAANFYFADQVDFEEQAAQKFLTPDVSAHLKALSAAIPSVDQFSKEGIEEFLKTFIEANGIKFKVLAQPLRVALTGKTVSPGIDEIMVTLGKEKVIQRINTAVAYIDDQKQ